jgi:hypothetical protein
MDVVSLIEVEPEFRAPDEPPDLPGKKGGGPQAPVLSLPPGPWEPPMDAEAHGLGYLIVEGMLLRRVATGSGYSVELLGPGDFMLPWREEPSSFSSAGWEVVDRARLAVLDLRPSSLLSRWPTVASTLAGRAIDRSRRLAMQAAIMSVVGIEDRLYAMLWALAERWGRITPEGTRLEVHVPQAVLAEMIGARRPTVSMALRGLVDRELLTPEGPGRWLLLGDAPVPVTLTARRRRPAGSARR